MESKREQVERNELELGGLAQKNESQSDLDDDKFAQQLINGGNPNIKKYGFTTERENPLVEKMTLRMDEEMKAAIKAGKLPNWQEIARQAIAEKLQSASA